MPGEGELCCAAPRHYQKLGDRPGTGPSRAPSGGAWHCPCLHLRTLASRLCNSQFLSSGRSVVVLWYRSPSRLTVVTVTVQRRRHAWGGAAALPQSPGRRQGGTPRAGRTRTRTRQTSGRLPPGPRASRSVSPCRPGRLPPSPHSSQRLGCPWPRFLQASAPGLRTCRPFCLKDSSPRYLSHTV